MSEMMDSATQTYDDPEPEFGSGRGGSPRVEIDTSAPFGSVEEAVIRFGGRGFWAPRVILHSPASDNANEFDMRKLEEQAAEMLKDLDTKQRETLAILKELEQTKRLIEELKLKLHKETTELVVVPPSPTALVMMELKQAKRNLSQSTNDLEAIRASVECVNKKVVKKNIHSTKTVSNRADELSIKQNNNNNIYPVYSAHAECEELPIKKNNNNNNNNNNNIYSVYSAHAESGELSIKQNNNNNIYPVYPAHAECGELPIKQNNNNNNNNIYPVYPAHAECAELSIKQNKNNNNNIYSVYPAHAECGELPIKQNNNNNIYSVYPAHEHGSRVNVLHQAGNEQEIGISRELRELNFEAEQFMNTAEAAKSEVLRAMCDIENTKAGLKMIEMRWVAAKKLEEAAKATEALALAEIKALSLSSSNNRECASPPPPPPPPTSLAEKARKAEDKPTEMSLKEFMSRVEAANRRTRYTSQQPPFNDNAPRFECLQRRGGPDAGEPRHGSTSIGDILSRKLVLRDDLDVGRRNERQRVSLDQMLHRQRTETSPPPPLPPTKGGGGFFSKRRNLGFVHISKQSKNRIQALNLW